MRRNISKDPRSIRAEQAFHQALKDLLKTKPYESITITDISRKACFSRHTFYNHYDGKEELLHNVIDTILDVFFSPIGPWEKVSRGPDGNMKIGQRFFEIWKKNADIVKILNTVDVDCLLINRLKTHFTEYFNEYFPPKEISGASEELMMFLIILLAYSYAGVLRQWLLTDMRYSPEVMGQFLNHFTGVEHGTVIDKFKDLIR